MGLYGEAMTLRCVPVEPTDEMFIAGTTRKSPQNIWELMLATAPPPPADIAEALEVATGYVTIESKLSVEQYHATVLARALLKSWGREAT